MTGLTLVIGNQNYSSWSLRPWLFLAHHEIPFNTKKVKLFTESMARDLSVHFSDTKVPVLLDGDLEVWDSLAILEYLAEQFPEKQGWPADRAARAVARSAAAEMHSGLFGLRNELPMNCRRRFPGFKPGPAAQRDIDRVQALWRYCREQYGAAGPWLFGHFSVADCMYAPVVMRLLSYEVALDPLSKAYTETLYHSPAMQQWIKAGREEPEVIDEDEADWPSVPF
ncbi:glutathione S-transferase family protein [Sedimenticola selenatireducens]|uniref:Glutathione S-transferase family protein n=1 Tax=Sedimenticola selenatireducens TaxID=191960 RepID=A0A557SM28_9GAMM|nr:glutathione S-transferase family protein [Sedimenticola selenatireducens]TVO78485.1 glutathione S-transferase family protein [Sedimenticola selenatireducens]TVT62656.1 MAG: glutathione S-transferase family protein [Sedimenticola selenatireducens]